MEDDIKSPLLEHSESMGVSIPQASSRDSKKSRKVMVKIRGMECAPCAVSIESVVRKMEGIESISVSPLQGLAIIVYRPDIINVTYLFFGWPGRASTLISFGLHHKLVRLAVFIVPNFKVQLLDAVFPNKKVVYGRSAVSSSKINQEVIEDAGFHVEKFPQDTSICLLRIRGMACTSCSEAVEQALLLVDGVKKAVVGLALEEGKIHFDPNVTGSKHLIEAIEDAGFGADLIISGDDTNIVHLIVKGLSSLKDATLNPRTKPLFLRCSAQLPADLAPVTIATNGALIIGDLAPVTSATYGALLLADLAQSPPQLTALYSSERLDGGVFACMFSLPFRFRKSLNTCRFEVEKQKD